MVVKVAKQIWSTGVIVASYVAQAAAATAAFIAENAATLGIIAGIALLVAAIIYLATHWRQVWGEVRRLAKDAWDFLTHGWGQVLIPQLYVIRKVVEFVRAHWRQAWGDITGAARDAWGVIQRIGGSIANLFTRTLPGVFHDGVNSISSAWSRLGNVLKGPVNWVIGNVINGLIRAFDWVSSKVGGPNIKIVPQLARGGKLPGFGGGDILPALLEPGETVVSKEHSRTPAAQALFEAMGVPGYQQGGVAAGHPLRPRSLGQAAPHAGLGGLGQAIGGIFHKAADVGKIMAAVTSGNTRALTNAIIDMIPGGVGGATAMMAQLLTAEPHKLLQEIVHKLISLGEVSGSGAAIVRYAESFLGKIPYVWGGTSVPGGADCSGFTQAVYRHFGIMAPRTSEAQGTWVQRGAPRAGGLAFYDSPAGGAPPGHVAIVRNATSVISQGGGMGPTLMGLHGMPLMYTGVPPGGFGTGGRGVNATGPLQLFARRLLASYGWAGQWPSFNALEMSEAGWDPLIVNPSSGAYGIPQALPGSKMASAGADWRTSGYTQLRWMMNYIRTNPHFHDPASAWAFHQRNNWYDRGGWLSPEAMLNGTGRPEAVLNPGQSQAFLNLAEAAHQMSRGSSGGGALMRDVHLMLPEGTTLAEALREIGWALRTTRQQSFTGVSGG
jgi:cell wall-associated NlpC family hydrolase